MNTRTAQVFVQVLLSITMLVSLAACGAQEARTPSSTSQPTVSAPTQEPQAQSTTAPSEEPSAATEVPPEQPTALLEIPSEPPPMAQGEIALTEPDGTIVLLHGNQRLLITQPVQNPSADATWDCDDTIGMELSPDGYRFATNNGVWTFGATADTHVLSPFWGWSHRWSPTGQQLAWFISAEEHTDLMMVGGPDGDEAKDVAGGHWGFTGHISWSPDEQLLIGGPEIQASFADGDPAALPAERGQNAVWSPDGKQLVWTSLKSDEKTVLVIVVLWDGEQQRDLTTITLPRGAPDQLAGWWDDPGIPPPQLHWLPDGSAVLLPMAAIDSNTGPSTWLIGLDGAPPTQLPYQLCDLATDGVRMLSRTGQGTIAVVGLPSGKIEKEIGPGINAAWRPGPHGKPPAAPLAEKSPRLASGDESNPVSAVKELQQRLTDIGYDLGEVDGIFGERTEAAVRQFQEHSGITVDGIVGPETWASLRLPGATRPQETE